MHSHFAKMNGNTNGNTNGTTNGTTNDTTNGNTKGKTNGNMYGNMNGKMNGNMNGNISMDQGMFSRRSRFTVVVLKYNFIAFILIALPTFYYYNYYSRPCYLIDDTITFNFSCAVALLVLLPKEGLLWLNVLFNLWPEQPDRYRNAKKVRKFSRLMLCLASKGDNIDVCDPHAQPS